MNGLSMNLRERALSKLDLEKVDVSQLTSDEVEHLLQELQIHQIELEMQNEQLKSAQVALEQSRDQYAKLYHLAPVGYCTLDRNNIIVKVNQTLADLLKTEQQRLINRPMVRFVHPDDLSPFLHQVEKPGESGVVEFRMVATDETTLYVGMSISPFDEEGEEKKRLLAISDISSSHEMATQLEIQSWAMEKTMDGIMISDANNRIFYVNPAFEKVTGYLLDEIKGEFPNFLHSGRHDEVFYREMWHAISTRGFWKGEIWNRRKSGEVYPEWLTINVIPDVNGKPSYYVGVFSDITEQKEVEEALAYSEESSRLLLESAGEGIYGIDLDYKTTFANPALEKMLGYRAEELIGQPGHPLFHHSHSDGRRYPMGECPILLTLRDGMPRHVSDEVFWRKDGSFFPVEYDSTPIFRNRKVDGVVVVFRDITERREAEQALHKAKQDAEELASAKSDFLATMSHELRTPLTSIIGNCELLMEKEDNEEHHELLRAIEASGQTQLTLVNDILDISKIESGKFTIEEAPYDLAELLIEIEQMLSNRAQEANLELVIEQKNREENLLMGDSHRIKQVLINLIGNAIKFTDQGTISLTTDSNGESLVFVIADTGIGISPEILDRLFQRFEQADGSISRRFGGSGLGLYISNSLTDIMEGTLNVSSRVGVGSIFELTLPYRCSDIPVQRKDARSEHVPVPEEKLTGHILIAEDTPELQLLERRILEGLGLTVTTVNDGREAVDLASVKSFDLILMDMQMPVMDGIEATRALRAQDNPVPIVALTANVMQKHRDLFYEAGCDDFLSKPIDRQELRRILNRYLKSDVDREMLERLGKPEQRSRERRAADTSGREENKRSEHRRQRDRAEEAANRQHPDVNEFVDDELMLIFRESIIKHRAALLEALSDKNWNRIKGVAHPIKGSGTSFGFPQLTERAKAVCDAYDNDQREQLPSLVEKLVAELDRAVS